MLSLFSNLGSSSLSAQKFDFETLNMDQGSIEQIKTMSDFQFFPSEKRNFPKESVYYKQKSEENVFRAGRRKDSK